MTATLCLLGPALLRRGGAEAPWPCERGCQLLAWLSQQPDWVSRERAATLFWPALDAEAARRNLRKVLHRLTPHLSGNVPPLEQDGGALRWRIPSDVQAFEQAVARGDAAAALALWRGTPFDGLDDGALNGFADWLRGERRRLEALCQQARLAAGRTATLAGTPADDPADAPAPAGGFVGRQAELVEIERWHADAGARWLTVSGPGGVGKTRLVAQALPVLAVRERDGATHVPFADIDDLALAGTRLATALGLTLGGSGSALDQVAAALAGQQRLLAFDNLDHLEGLGALLHGALAKASGVRVMATSRHGLGVAGERLLVLGGLPYPGPEDVERAAGFDAVRLFERHAARHGPAFALAPQRAAIAALCERVDGLPLALEVAAAWARHFAVDEIVRSLDAGGAEMLAPPGGGRGLAAIFEHAWRGLDGDAQHVLARLTVFSGGCTLEAACAVTGGSAATLASLVDRSLLRSERQGGRQRFTLHPLLQQFAAARLDDREREVARDALAAWFAQTLARTPPREQLAAHLAALEALTPELANLRTAWQHAAARGRTELLALALKPLMRLYMRRADWDGALALVDAARPAAAEQPALRARLDAAASLLCLYGGDPTQAAARARAALRPLRRAGDTATVMECLWALGQAAYTLTRTALAARCFGEGVTLAHDAGDVTAQANFLDALSSIEYSRGHYAEQARLLEQSIALRERIDADVAITLSNLGNALNASGRRREAVAAYERALLAARGPFAGRERANAGLNLALLHLERGALEDAGRAADAAAAELERYPEPRIALHVQAVQAGIDVRRGRLAEAEARLRSALVEAHRRAMVAEQIALLIGWAELGLARGRAVEALGLLRLIEGHAALPRHRAGDVAALRTAALAAAGARGARPAAAPSSLQAAIAAVVAQAGTVAERPAA